jgi:NAD(P)H-hydrate epimerase
MKFSPNELKNLYVPPQDSKGEDNGEVAIIGGSSLFHGAPLLSLRVASRIVDMVFFSSPEKTMEEVASYIKADLSAFIWVPWKEIEEYIEKSDAVLIGPGFMRAHTEKDKNDYDEGGDQATDESFQFTKKITNTLLAQFPHKKWVIDAGSLQTLELENIPENAILTPNDKEYELLFQNQDPLQVSEKYKCVIVRKGVVGKVYAKGVEIEIEGGNPGLTKGGTGDVQAGLTVAFLAKNDPLLSAAAASYVVKHTADELQKKIGTFYNADDLADSIPGVLATLIK